MRLNSFFELVRKIIRKISRFDPPDLTKIIKILDENPKLKEINKDFVNLGKKIWL